MEVILKQTVEKLGKMGEVVKVRDGYARNYLFPQEIAILASKSNKHHLESLQKKQKIKEEKEQADAVDLAKKVEAVVCEIEAKVGEENKLYGSVTAQDIAKFYKEAGFKIEKKHVLLEESIKEVGTHEVEIKLAPEAIAKIKVTVVGKKS